jgi:hypothetical protein
MTNGQTGIGRRAVLGGVAAAGTATYMQRALAADPLKQVPRNRTYIVASSNDGPTFRMPITIRPRSICGMG